ncbi:MAG TPA: MBL fold metallo-hydrolase [Casimicrobiaceae bacterium]|jgi:glyoxylase-like metal-dependent hydrolase (beta-lactamase superfamily II)
MSVVLDYPFDVPPAPGEACEVAPQIHWLRMPLPFALDHINIWSLRETHGFTQVDSGYGDAATRELWSRHFDTTLRGEPITRIVATHCHPDHLGNAKWLSDRFGSPVAMTESEYLAAHAIIDQRATHAVNDTCALFRRHGMTEEHLAALAARGNQYKRGVPEAPAHFQRLIAGDRFTAGRTTWQVIAGFGHSPEHAALYSENAGVLVSGDMLLPKITTNVAVWPVEPDGDPLARFLSSLAAFETLPPDTLVLPSHGLPFRGIALRVAQLRAHHAVRLNELSTAVAAAQAPQSAADVIPVLFRRPLDLQQRFFAMGEAIAHLNHLWHARRINRVSGADDAIRFAA